MSHMRSVYLVRIRAAVAGGEVAVVLLEVRAILGAVAIAGLDRHAVAEAHPVDRRHLTLGALRRRDEAHRAGRHALIPRRPADLPALTFVVDAHARLIRVARAAVRRAVAAADRVPDLPARHVGYRP